MSSRDSSPAFSVIIPTYDRPQPLVALLTSLSRMAWRDFEVIVVDDGGRVPVAPRIAAFDGRLRLSLIRQQNHGPAAARNAGAARARGRYLAFTDDDCIVDARWLSALARTCERLPEHACGGRTASADGASICSVAHQLLMDYLCERYSLSRRVGAFFPSNNLCVPRGRFIEVGGFDVTMRYGEDRDFCDRWAARGFGVTFVPEAVVYHAHALTGLSLARLHFRYGGGSFQFWKRVVSRRGAANIDLSPPGFYLDLLRCGLNPGTPRAGAPLAALLAVTQGANAAGMIWEAVKERPRGL